MRRYPILTTPDGERTVAMNYQAIGHVHSYQLLGDEDRLFFHTVPGTVYDFLDRGLSSDRLHVIRPYVSGEPVLHQPIYSVDIGKHTAVPIHNGRRTYGKDIANVVGVGMTMQESAGIRVLSTKERPAGMTTTSTPGMRVL